MPETGSKEGTFNPDENIERLVELADNLYVHGKFPDGASIRGIPIRQYDPGSFSTIRVQDGAELRGVLWHPPQFDDRDFRSWYEDPEHAQRLLFTVQGTDNPDIDRVYFYGVAQHNPAIRDSRTRPTEVSFQFDLPDKEMALFYHLFTKDRKQAPKHIERLLRKLYAGLIAGEDDESKKKGIIIKPLEQIIGIDETFVTQGEKFHQTNPNRIFPPPKAA